MEKMEVDDVVDLSVPSNRDTLSRDLRALTQNSGLTITPAPPPLQQTISLIEQQQPMEESGGHAGTGSVLIGGRSRRVLRPRTEPKSYAECPDIVLLPAKINGRPQNGNIDSESEDDSMPPLPQMKELSTVEIWERERGLRKLREELRNEETKLVLLKKLKQSQQVMKENLVVTPTNIPVNPLAGIPAALTKGSLSVTPTTSAPLPAHSKNRQTSILRGQPVPGRSNTGLPPPRSSLPGGATLTPGPPHRSSMGHSRTGSNLTITPSVTITPTSAPPAGSKPRNVSNNNISNSVSITPAPSMSSSGNDMMLKNERSSSRDDGQTPAQRQAAAKLALRKQLEKTLLQIPPPKPPPPEMHFIPNPSNTEFVYLLGLEHVVDYITKDKKNTPLPQQPFRCAQCKIDFTPVWKWEKQGKGGNPTFQNTPVGKDPKVICEQCVTTNVKKALKQEHTNRLKTAFVKALQQEQEIEQRLASQSSPSPIDTHISTSIPSSVTVSHPAPAKTPTPAPRPTPPPPSQPTPPPPQSSSSRSRQQHHDNSSTSNSSSYDKFSAAQLSSLGNLANLGNLGSLGNLGNLANLGNMSNSNAAMQAFQQQLFRGIQGIAGGNSPAHMMQLTPFLYSYQLAMAQAAQAMGKPSSGKNPSMSDLQRAAEIQRQYLLEMMPPQPPGPSNSRQNNWKT